MLLCGLSRIGKSPIGADATVKGTSNGAGVRRADAIVSTTDRDVTNVMTCLFDEGLDVPGVTSAVHSAKQMHRFRQIVMNVIEDPQQLVAGHRYRAVAGPAIVDYMQVDSEPEVSELTVTEAAPIAGKTLAEAGNANLSPDGVSIVAIEYGSRDEPLTPRGNTRIEANDLLVAYSAVEAERELTDTFGRSEDQTA